MTDDFKSGEKYKNRRSDRIYKCIYVSPKGNAILQDETGLESFADRGVRDFFVEIIPEVVVIGYISVDGAGYVYDFSFHGNRARPAQYSVTFTNKGGEITAKIEKL